MEELIKLKELYTSGALDYDEFERRRIKIVDFHTRTTYQSRFNSLNSKGYATPVSVTKSDPSVTTPFARLSPPLLPRNSNASSPRAPPSPNIQRPEPNYTNSSRSQNSQVQNQIPSVTSQSQFQDQQLSPSSTKTNISPTFSRVPSSLSQIQPSLSFPNQLAPKSPPPQRPPPRAPVFSTAPPQYYSQGSPRDNSRRDGTPIPGVPSKSPSPPMPHISQLRWNGGKPETPEEVERYKKFMQAKFEREQMESAARRAQKTTQKDLFTAAMGDDLQKIDELLNKGVDVNSTEETRLATPLILACDQEKPKKNTIIYLVTRGADINLQDKNGDSCLHMLVKHKQFELAAGLVKLGGNLDLPNLWGRTPRMGWSYSE